MGEDFFTGALHVFWKIYFNPGDARHGFISKGPGGTLYHKVANGLFIPFLPSSLIHIGLRPVGKAGGNIG